MENKIFNYTPHDVVLYNEDATEIVKVFPSVGTIRLASTTEPAGEFDGVPLTKTVYGKPEGLPECQEDVCLIVSAMVKNACPGRGDLLVPGEQVRDDKGRVIGCKSLGI